MHLKKVIIRILYAMFLNIFLKEEIFPKQPCLIITLKGALANTVANIFINGN